jgi:hypothetical protein
MQSLVNPKPSRILIWRWDQPTNNHNRANFSFKRVVYDDIKLELLDHIATEIESIIDEVSFHLKKT